MSDNNSSGFSWFLAGLGIGSLIGVLYAPKPGSETREELVAGALGRTEYLKQRSREVSTQVGDLVERSKGQVGDLVERSKGQVTDYVSRGKDYVDTGKERIGGVVGQAQHLVTEHSAKAQAAFEAGKQAYVETQAPAQPVTES